MITATEQLMSFCFPEVHPNARLRVSLHRTLRVPDDGKDYPLPAGLGQFPVRHTDDYAGRVPESWQRHGGIIVPMYQAEAMWLRFEAQHIDRRGVYPFVIKVATGKINAVSGETWKAEPGRTPQDYVVAPPQKWLDGYSVGKDVVRQFVAMPLGKGYTVEEQVTGKAEFGGVQIQVYPMKREAFEKRFPEIVPVERQEPRPRMPKPKSEKKTELPDNDSSDGSTAPFSIAHSGNYSFSLSGDLDRKKFFEMGLAPGGRIQQQIIEDPYQLHDWDLTHTSRCFVHLCNSDQWQAVTHEPPPTTPVTADAYQKAGIPWYSHYEEKVRTTRGSAILSAMETVTDWAKSIRSRPPKGNKTIADTPTIDLVKKKTNEVRDSEW